jgi:phospholipid/cholesterol/gamma-HCH transport system ATP-binding protein
MSIEMRDIHKAFGETKVLQGFTLDVPDGEVVTVIGPSGSGKSTTLKTIIGLLEPDQGEVRVDGENVHELGLDGLYALRRKVGYVFQFAALFDSMTVEQNVAMGLKRIPGLSPAEIHERVEEVLAHVDLEGVGDRYPAELSGGMKKRAGLARAIALSPRYLLYDEPTTGLDPLTVTMVDRLILRMRDELGVTSLVITHDIDSAYRISDHIAMLYDGRVLEVGTPDQIRASQNPRVRAFIEGKPELLKEAE